MLKSRIYSMLKAVTSQLPGHCRVALCYGCYAGGSAATLPYGVEVER